MTPPRLQDRDEDAVEVITDTEPEATRSTPETRVQWMFHDAAEPPHHVHRPEAHLQLVRGMVGKALKLSPTTTRRMENARYATGPTSGIPVNVVTVDARYLLVVTGATDKKGGNVHGSTSNA